MKKICPICNEEFETNIPSQIYCSKYCSNKRRRLKAKNKEFHKICECCGKEFTTKSNVKYCSEECKEIKSNEYHNLVYKKYCKYCNTYFETKNNSQVYCSEECRENFYKERQVLNNNNKNNNKNRKKKKYKRICKTCGKEFSTNSTNSKYCSEKCKQKNKNKKLNKLVTCKTCGKKFSTIHNKKYCSKECRDTKQKICPICEEKFSTKTGRKYCSEECRKIEIKYKNKVSQTELDLRKNNDSIRLIFNGKPINTWYTPGFTEELRNKILERDGYKCYICGKETNLHVHHIIPRDEGGPHIPENLVTLCGSCHRSVESGNTEKIIKKCLKAFKKIPKGIHKIIY